jgi:hypothetical protein
MEAIKQIVRVKDHKITIQLKPEMNNTKVEVIIIPFPQKKHEKDNIDSGIKELLSIGVWSESDIKAMEDVSGKFNVWTVQKF